MPQDLLSFQYEQAAKYDSSFAGRKSEMSHRAEHLGQLRLLKMLFRPEVLFFCPLLLLADVQQARKTHAESPDCDHVKLQDAHALFFVFVLEPPDSVQELIQSCFLQSEENPIQQISLEASGRVVCLSL